MSTLDEELGRYGYLVDYDSKETLETQGVDDDIMAVSIDANKKSYLLSKKMGRFHTRIHRMNGNVLASSLVAIAIRSYHRCAGKQETTLRADYDEIHSIFGDLHDSLGTLFYAYQVSFNKIWGLYKHKSIDLMSAVEMRKQALESKNVNERLRKSVVKKLEEIRTEEGLSPDEVKYSDALANLDVRRPDVDGGLEFLSRKIERSSGMKKILFDERAYHSSLLKIYSEAYDISKDFLSLFDATMPSHLGAADCALGFGRLVVSVDGGYNLTKALHEKTKEGMKFVSGFNERYHAILGGNGKAKGPKKTFNPDSYIAGLIGPGDRSEGE